MLISPGQVLFGVSAKLLQFAAIELGDEFNTIELARELGAPVSEVSPVIQALLAAGWILPCTGEKARYEYKAAMPWGQLRLARTGKPLPRERADVLVVEMLERVRAANRAPSLDRGLITRVAIFGSYLNPEKSELGDIDIAFSWAYPERAKGLPRIDTPFCVERNAAKVIKNQSQYIGLSYFDMLEDLGCEYREVYNAVADVELWLPPYTTADAYPEFFRALQAFYQKALADVQSP